MITLEQRIKAFSTLGQRLRNLSQADFQLLADNAKNENPWFTPTSIKMAIGGVAQLLDEGALGRWISRYNVSKNPKTIALVLAGNIPLVGFHDFLSVLVSGHSVLIKLSSKDSVLMRYVCGLLTEIEPAFTDTIKFADQLKDFDAVIATGSDNSSRYFDYYFGKYPHIIRGNRTSCAILTGDETEAEFQKLGMDVFSYFGLGCRNVSKLYVPEGYNFTPLFESWEIFKEVGYHHKYCNNYDYQKSIMLINRVPFLDNGFVMLTPSEKTVSPISVVYHESYNTQENLDEKIALIKNKLQCIVGSTKPATIPFGQAQYPQVWDYADQIDTLEFLCGLG